MATTAGKNSVEQGKRDVKAAPCIATVNDSLQAKGKADQVKEDIKQAGEKVKDAARK